MLAHPRFVGWQTKLATMETHASLRSALPEQSHDVVMLPSARANSSPVCSPLILVPGFGPRLVQTWTIRRAISLIRTHT